MIPHELATFLAAHSSVTDLVGGASRARIYVTHAPQRPAFPLVVVTAVGDVGDQHLNGPSGLSRARLQVDMQAAKWSAVSQLADAIRDACDGHAGAFGHVTAQRVGVEDARGDYEEGQDLQRAMLDVVVWYERA